MQVQYSAVTNRSTEKLMLILCRDVWETVEMVQYDYQDSIYPGIQFKPRVVWTSSSELYMTGFAGKSVHVSTVI